jgi:hypothetical protein
VNLSCSLVCQRVGTPDGDSCPTLCPSRVKTDRFSSLLRRMLDCWPASPPSSFWRPSAPCPSREAEPRPVSPSVWQSAAVCSRGWRPRSVTIRELLPHPSVVGCAPSPASREPRDLRGSSELSEWISRATALLPNSTPTPFCNGPAAAQSAGSARQIYGLRGLATRPSSARASSARALGTSPLFRVNGLSFRIAR